MDSALGASTAAPPVSPRLDDEQRAAVEHTDGPLLIVAGAGTGKTTVIARRIAHLIETKRARPSQILALAFNDKAAAEMQERVDLLVPYGYADVSIQTFHAFGEEVLSSHGLEIGIAPGFAVLDKTSQALFIAERLEELGLKRYMPLSDPTRYVSTLADFFGRAKDDPQWPEDVRRAAAEAADRAAAARAAGGGDETLIEALEDRASRLAELGEAYERYNALLWRAGFLDFGDLLALTLRLFEQSPAALRRLQERFRYVLVDEFQDTNPVQFKIVRRLVETHRNLVVVGDDDQSIYRFRGAHLKNILEFREHYPGTKEIVLRRNYRSTRQILARSRRLILQNQERLEVRYGISKELITEKDGDEPLWKEFETEADEAAWVADRIAIAVREKRRRPRDFAILVRNNKHAEPFLRALDERGIDYYFSGSRGLFQRPEIKELISLLQSLYQDSRPEYLYLLASEAYGVPEDDLAKLMHALARDPAPLRALFRRAAEGKSPLDLSDEGRDRLRRLLEDVDALQEFARGKRTGEVLYHYLDRRGTLKELMAARTFEDEARARNIVKFFALIRSFEKVALADRVSLFLRHFEAIREFGEDPSVAELDETSDVVQVQTIHRAKGLEFPVVFMVQMATHRFPTANRARGIELPREEDEEDPSAAHREEERRLCYVAFTRAREELITTYARDYGGKQKRKASLFLAEAFDLGKEPPARTRRRVLDEIADLKVIEKEPPARERPGGREPIHLSYQRLQDYEDCPYKFRLLHAISVNPILTVDHRVNFGNAVHQAVAHANRRRAEGAIPTLDEMVDVFRAVWRSEGYRNEEHERQRFAQGVEALREFHRREIAAGPPASAVERHFRVKLEDVVVSGSIDRVDEAGTGVTLVDYKTSEKDDDEKADKASKESLQLSVYALAYRELTGRLPDRLELRYVLTGVTGTSECGEERVAKAKAKIEEIAAAIRREEFGARPEARRCSICACRPICRESAV
ncbi:MAG TPA: ATP-dependent DNA helicase [Candidatus Eisenbacteria bacterium]|nr:ATP-dependent DNA helicase [Candidatus Eisenbacteria bacterium]